MDINNDDINKNSIKTVFSRSIDIILKSFC